MLSDFNPTFQCVLITPEDGDGWAEYLMQPVFEGLNMWGQIVRYNKLQKLAYVTGEICINLNAKLVERIEFHTKTNVKVK